MNPKITVIVLVAALGYFVDAFDLVLFSVVRSKSLNDLGVVGEAALTEGVRLINYQMVGMLVGGVLWGVLGDKIGRVRVLFGSILAYALANIANSFVSDVNQYAVLRFISGVGLAGEIGGAITLVGEVLSKERRGLGMAAVLTAGALGALLAGSISHLLDWRTMYIIGGVLGLALLVLRMSVSESGVYSSIKKDQTIRRGDLWLLFANRDRALRFLALISIGMPFVFCWAFLVTFSPELALHAVGLQGVSSSTPIVIFSIGVTLGDLSSSLVSQRWKRRKSVLATFIALQACFVAALIHLNFGSVAYFNAWFLPIGFCSGYWAVLVTTASEQYGTNLRTTVTSMVPNLVRGTSVILGWCFLNLKASVGIVDAVQILVLSLAVLSITALKVIRESFGISLAFIEVRGGQKRYEPEIAPQPQKASGY